MNPRLIHNIKHDIRKYEEICRNNIITFGKDSEITKSHLRELGRLIYALSMLEGGKANV